MNRRSNRHQRGIRGPLSQPSAFLAQHLNQPDKHSGDGGSQPVSVPNPSSSFQRIIQLSCEKYPQLTARRRPSDTEIFAKRLGEAITIISKTCPQALANISIGFTDVPPAPQSWEEDQNIALADAYAPTEDESGQITIYRRPIELRSSNYQELAELIRHTLVKQLSAISGIPVEIIDPNSYDE